MFKDLEMMDSEYNFKLDSYPDHVKAVLKEIVSDSVFSDVTLVFDDFQIMKASRNVLSACSPVLKNILRELYDVSTSNINPLHQTLKIFKCCSL